MKTVFYVLAAILAALFFIGLLTGTNLGMGTVVWALLVLATMSFAWAFTREGTS